MTFSMKKTVSILILVVMTLFLSACTEVLDNQPSGLGENKPTLNNDVSLKMQEVAKMSDQDLLYRYVNSIELSFKTLTFKDPNEIPSESLIKLFLYSLNTKEKYAEYEKRWLSTEDGQFHIPIADINEQLDTILEHHNLIPSEIYGYNPKEDAVITATITGFGGEVWTKLQKKSIDGSTLILTVDIFTDDSFEEIMYTKDYTIRFDTEGYKYLSIDKK